MTKIEGFKQLRRNINQLQDKARKRIYRKAVKDSFEVAAAKARQLAPIDSGGIQRAIVTVAANQPSKEFYGRRLGINSKIFRSNRTARRRRSGSNYQPDHVERYYRFQEFGTKYHKATPFLAPALENSKGEIISNLSGELGRGIEREAKRIARNSKRS